MPARIQEIVVTHVVKFIWQTVLLHHLRKDFRLRFILLFPDRFKISSWGIIANIHVVRILKIGEISYLVNLPSFEIKLIEQKVSWEQMMLFQALSFLL